MFKGLLGVYRHLELRVDDDVPDRLFCLPRWWPVTLNTTNYSQRGHDTVRCAVIWVQEQQEMQRRRLRRTTTSIPSSRLATPPTDEKPKQENPILGGTVTDGAAETAMSHHSSNAAGGGQNENKPETLQKPGAGGNEFVLSGSLGTNEAALDRLLQDFDSCEE